MNASRLLPRALALAALAATWLVVAGANAQEPDAAEKPAQSEEENGTEPTEPKAEDKKDDATEKESDDSPAPAVAAHASVSSSDVALAVRPASGRFRRLWLGAAGSFELVFLSQGSDVCKLTPQAIPVGPLGAYCTNPGGSDFPSRQTPAQNDSLLPGRAGQLDGGVKIGDVRVLIAADYAVNGSLLAGLRLGYVLNDYPGDAAVSGRAAFLRNVHLEARGTYLFGPEPLTRVSFAPMAFAGAGLAPTDGHSLTQVTVARMRGPTPVNAWQIGGPGYIVVGGGTRYAFSPRAAFTMAWKASLGFGGGTALFTTGPELGLEYGF